MNRQPALQRREFLAAVGSAASAAYLIPSGVLAAAGKSGANQRLTVAQVGIGGMGGAHLGMMLKFRELGVANIAAVCEVDENRLRNALKKVGPGCTPYRDYRYVLERRDVDAVIIATPDHWHAVQTVHACESGKHVYVEKPASCTVEEGKAMVAAAGKHRRVVQVGSQARSAKPAHDACTFIRNGMLGKVRKVTCWHSLNPTGGTQAPAAPPPELDWDLWLGPLRWRPYVPGAYCPGVFRWLMESGGGVIRDRGAHVMSVALWCMDADRQTPVSVEATGTPTTKGIWDCPPRMKVVYTFKDPDWQLIWEQPGDVRGPGGFGLVFHGEKDTLVVCRDGTRIDAELQSPRRRRGGLSHGQARRLQHEPQGGLDPGHQGRQQALYGHRDRPSCSQHEQPGQHVLPVGAETPLGRGQPARPRRPAGQPHARQTATVSVSPVMGRAR